MLKIIIIGIKRLIKHHDWKEVKLTFKALRCWLWLRMNSNRYYRGDKMEFLVTNRNEIKDYTTDKKHIVFSIRDSNTKRVKLPDNDNRVATMWLEFSDLDKEVKGYKLFSKSNAKDILDFVKMFKDKIELIVCQCEAGISRSSGIAGALSKIFNGDDDYFFKHYIPNRLVYKLILREAEKRGMMNKIMKAEKDIKEGRIKTGEEVFNDLQKKIGCKCQSCGKQYRVDLLIPDELWEKIKPQDKSKGAGLLCGLCIMKKIEQFKNYGVYRMKEIESQEILKERIEKALAKADKCDPSNQKNLLGSKKKYVNEIIEELLNDA